MIWHHLQLLTGFPGSTVVKNTPANAQDARDAGLIPGSGRSSGGGSGNPLQYPCLGNPMDRGAWWTTVRGVTKHWTQLSTHAVPHILSDKCQVLSNFQLSEGCHLSHQIIRGLEASLKFRRQESESSKETVVELTYPGFRAGKVVADLFPLSF